MLVSSTNPHHSNNIEDVEVLAAAGKGKKTQFPLLKEQDCEQDCVFTISIIDRTDFLSVTSSFMFDTQTFSEHPD